MCASIYIYHFGHLAELVKTERSKCETVIENNLEELVPQSEQRSWEQVPATCDLLVWSYLVLYLRLARASHYNPSSPVVESLLLLYVDGAVE